MTRRSGPGGPARPALRALICGAGPAGMALAQLLTAKGWSVTVVERSPEIRPGGYAVDLRGDGLAVAERLGLLEQLRERQTRMTGTTVLDPAGHRLDELPPEEFGGDLEVPKAVLTQLQFEKTRHDVEYLFANSVRSIGQDAEGVVATLDDGTVRRTDLVVGADGVWSRVRRLALTSDPTVVHHLGLSGVGFTTDNFLGLERHGVLRQTPGTAVYAFSGDDRDRLTVSLTIANEQAALDRAERADQEAAVRRAFVDQEWLVPELLQRMSRSEDFYFASASQVHLDRWSDGRVVLLGDAACCAAPTSGMGTTQAFLGARALADALDTHDLADALRRYEESVRPMVRRNQALGVEGAARFGAIRSSAGRPPAGPVGPSGGRA